MQKYLHNLLSNKFVLFILCICVFFIVIIIGIKNASYKAKKIAENFLSNKYQTEMVFENIKSDFINGGWYVYFYPENNPEINFRVRIFGSYTTVSDGEESNSHTGYLYTADNYLFSYMAYYIKEAYRDVTEKIWGDKARLSVVSIYSPYPIAPVGTNEEMTPDELSVLWDYYVNISNSISNIDYVYDEKTAIIGKIYDTIASLKSFDYNPNRISFSFCSYSGIFYKKLDDYLSIDFENWQDITSLEQVEEVVNKELYY